MKTPDRIFILFDQHAQIAALSQLAILIAWQSSPVDVAVSLALQGSSPNTPEHLHLHYRRDDSQPEPPSLVMSHRFTYFKSGQFPLETQDFPYDLSLRHKGGFNIYGCEEASFVVYYVVKLFLRNCQSTNQ